MNNKILIVIIGLSLASVIIGALGELFLGTESSLIIDYGFAFFIFMGTYLLVKNGEFIKTKESRLTRLSISIIIVGVLFKIMHWPMSGPILAVGFLSILIFYLIYIIRKGKRNLVVWIKLIFLTTFLMGRFFKMAHWPYSDELTIASFLLLCALIFEFIRNKNILIQK